MSHRLAEKKTPHKLVNPIYRYTNRDTVSHIAIYRNTIFCTNTHPYKIPRYLYSPSSSKADISFPSTNVTLSISTSFPSFHLDGCLMVAHLSSPNSFQYHRWKFSLYGSMTLSHFDSLHIASDHPYTTGDWVCSCFWVCMLVLFSSGRTSLGSLPSQTSDRIDYLPDSYSNLVFHLCILSNINFFMLSAIPIIPITSSIHECGTISYAFL